MYRIKICGIRTPSDARVAIKAGADALGFLVGTRYYTEDEVFPRRVKEILHAIDSKCLKHIKRVLVTHLLDARDIVRLLKILGFTYVQLHNAISVEEIKRLRDTLPQLKIIKAVHGNGENPLDTALLYAEYADALVVDTVAKTGNGKIRIGGTGKVHDWNITARIVEMSPVPVILAGGLNPENISYAIKQVLPYGVDVNSGVEDPRGNKHPLKVRQFVTVARGLLIGGSLLEGSLSEGSLCEGCGTE